MRIFSISCFLFLSSCIFSYSQNTTIEKQDKTDKLKTKIGKTDEAKPENFSVLIIPFEPKLYMSQIDKKVNEETKWSFNQIRNKFRSDLHFFISTELKKKFNTYSLLEDSVKTAKDLEYVYESIGYDYIAVPENNNGKIKTGKEQEQNNSGIKNGQIETDMKSGKRFMNTKIIAPDLLSYLSNKYGANTFVFINELDIKNEPKAIVDMNSSEAFEREVTVHYTIVDASGNSINSGIATSRFSYNQNKPKAIITENFSKISEQIKNNLDKTLFPQKKESLFKSVNKSK